MKLKNLFTGIFTVTLLLSCVSKKKYQALQKENEGLKNKVNTLDKQVTEFSNKLTEFERRNKELQDEIEELEQNGQVGLDDYMVDPDPSKGEYPTVLDKKAEYIGGEKALYEFLSKHLKYPSGSTDIAGKVFIKFVIDEKGIPSQYEVVKSAHPLLDAEALRVIKHVKKWIPAEVKGKPVKSEYILPVNFKIN